MTPTIIDHTLIHWRRTLSEASYSYPEVGASRGSFPDGYDHDNNACLLGYGNDLFRRAGRLVMQLQHFPSEWTRTAAADPLQEGQLVAVAFRLLGRWWYNACRVVYLIGEADRVGFAYGTTHRHVECGEEVFEVVRRPDGAVYFHIRAFSRPARWYTRLGYPVARRLQRKFVRDAFTQMQSLTRKNAGL